MPMSRMSISSTGVLLLALLAAQPRTARSQEPRPAPQPAGVAAEIAFPQLLKSGLAPGRYQVRCVIMAVRAPSCPPCPPRVACEPCPPPIVVFRISPTARGQVPDSSVSVDAFGGLQETGSLRAGLAYLLTLDVRTGAPPYRPWIVGATPLP
jgi:hypothetical protein